MALRDTAGKLSAMVPSGARLMLAVGSAAAISQTLLIREVLTVVAGNELVIGVMLAVWLAAVAAGSALGGRNLKPHPNRWLFGQIVSVVIGLVCVRGVRLLLMPGETPGPWLLCALLFTVEVPVAFCGGYIFGMLAGRGGGAAIYRWEQIGMLAGLGALSVAVALFSPNFAIAAVALTPLVMQLREIAWRMAGVALIIAFLLVDHPTSAWKYPLAMADVVYAREGEVARAMVDGQQLTYVNGSMYDTDYATPAVEQAVHTPLGMHPHPLNVLVVNNAGHLAEARKYRWANVRCIRTDRLIDDTCCPYGQLVDVAAGGPYDAIIIGSAMPDNVASSRFFTRGFFRRMHTLTGDSGLLSFTLPLQSDYRGGQDRVVRDIIVATLSSVFRYVRILPGEGLTFAASDADYPLPDTCRAPNDYFTTTVLAALTQGKIRDANEPPRQRRIHTAGHPRLLAASLDRYMQQFRIKRWMFVALPLLLVLFLLPAVRLLKETISIGSSGFCLGVFSIMIMLLYQSIYGTVYAHLSLLLLSLGAGLAAGGFLRKFPWSDLVVGLTTGGMLLGLSLFDTPPAYLFFMANALAGFFVSAQFVTRKRTPAGVLYAADCAGGVVGMSLASTILAPMFGVAAVAMGLVAIKAVAGVVAARSGGR